MRFSSYATELLRQKLGRSSTQSSQGFVYIAELSRCGQRSLNNITVRRRMKVELQCYLRHFHASVLFQQKQSLFAVSRRLGHASISTTADLYGHMLPGSGKEQADAFAHAMRLKPVDSG